MGVDVFFVLSGFLITTSIASQTQFSYASFYWRRFVRLSPALFAMCLIYLIVGLLFLDHQQTINDILSSIFYVSNWTRAFGTGVPQYLGQTWSLSIEEQFYIIYPAMFIISVHILDKNKVAFIFLTAAIVCVIYRLILYKLGMSLDRYYNGLDTHCDGLLFGCALALLQKDGLARRARQFLSRIDFIALIFLFYMFYAFEWSPVTVIIIDILSIWLIIGVSDPERSIAIKFISISPVVYIGQISYSLYIWHYPIFLFMYYYLRVSLMEQICIGIPLSLMAAMLSHRFVERSALAWRDRIDRSTAHRLGWITVTVTASLIGIGTYTYLGDEIKDRIAPPPLHIDAYGPQSTKVRHGFNVQPNGDSIVWVKTNTRPPEGAVAEWNGQTINLTILSRGFLFVAPPTLVDMVGHNDIVIKGEGRPIGTLTIDVTD